MLLRNAKDSYLVACSQAIEEAKVGACSQEEFIGNMKNKGWDVIWKDTRKNITFVNEEGKKVRDRNLNKTFNMNLSKDSLNELFRTNKSLIHESGTRKKSIRETLQEKKELSKQMDKQSKANKPKNKIRERMR